jgi:UDPglucose 6-dehydrogenase
MEKIGIIGVGILGGTAKVFYEESGREVFCYDKFKNIGSIEEVNNADIIFVCVPTPRKADNKLDISIVEEAVGYVSGEEKIIVIRSTVPVGTTDNLQRRHSKHKLLHNPEFLTEDKRWFDFRNPRFQIVGYTAQSEGVAQGVMGVLPTVPHLTKVKTMPATATEMFKLVRNGWLCNKNSYWNQIYDLCQALHVDYQFIKECAEFDPWIGPEHLEIWHKKKRGFNGGCLPKDSEGLVTEAHENNVHLSILEEVIRFNSELLASQNIPKDS